MPPQKASSRGQSYLHLLSLFVLGLSSCFITEVVLRYIVRTPRSYERGINYIISRNLRFQLINTPLVALLICLYRHFVMSSLVESNLLSLSNYLETLAIIAFLSFAIGLYWRFKFRSKYLAMELEETRLMNEELKEMQAKSLLSMSSDSPAVDTKVYSEVNEQNNSPVNEVEEPIEKTPPAGAHAHWHDQRIGEAPDFPPIIYRVRWQLCEGQLSGQRTGAYRYAPRHDETDGGNAA